MSVIQRKFSAGVAAAVCLTGLVAAPAVADEAEGAESPHTLGGSVAFTNDYVFRGTTQTSEEAAIQGSLDYSHASGLYASVWGSSIEFGAGDGESAEIDYIVGYSTAAGAISVDLSGIWYSYPGVSNALDFDYFEAALALGLEQGPFSVSASINYSPDYFAGTDSGWYYASSVSYQVAERFSVDLHVGHQEIKDNAGFGAPDYTDYSIGVGTSLLGFDLSLAFMDTDIKNSEGAKNFADERVVFTIGRSF